MEAEHQAFALALLDEQVLALQLADQLGGVSLPADVGRQVAVERADHGQPGQEAQHRWRQPLQDFLVEEPGHVLEGMPREKRRRVRCVEVRQARAGIAAETEQDSADPALAVGPQQVDEIAVQALPPAAGQLADFSAVQHQVLGFQGLQALIALQVAERDRGFAFAGGQQMQVLRRVAKQLLEVAAGRAGAQQVQIIQDQGEARRLALQMVDDARPEARFIGLARCRVRERQPQGMAQLRQQPERLIVAGIQPIPRPGQARLAEVERVLREERALPVAQGRPDQAQQHAFVGCVVQALQECRAWQVHGGYLRRAEPVALGGGMLHLGSVKVPVRGVKGSRSRLCRGLPRGGSPAAGMSMPNLRAGCCLRGSWINGITVVVR